MGQAQGPPCKYSPKLLFVLQRIQIGFKPHPAVKIQCLVRFGRHLFLLQVFPSTGVIFASAFSCKLQCYFVLPQPQRSLPTLSVIMCFYCFSTQHSCVSSPSHTPVVYLHLHVFQPVEKRLYDEWEGKENLSSQAEHLSNHLSHRNPEL